MDDPARNPEAPPDAGPPSEAPGLTAEASGRSASVDAAMARLESVRSWARVLLVVHRGAWLAALVVAVVVGAGLVDYVLRTPSWMRVLALGVGLVVLAGLLWRQVWPALRFNPPLEVLALRIESTRAGREARLPGVLASGVGLAGESRTPTIGGAMARTVTSEAASRFAPVPALRLFDLRPATRAALVCLVMLVATLGLIVVQPTLSMIGARRVLTPWAQAAWPKRTQLADATTARVHALGTALPLRAGLVRSAGSPESTLVEAHYRVVEREGGRSGPWQSLALNLQSGGVSVRATNIDGQAVEAAASLFSQDLPPGALMLPGQDAAAEGRELEYWFASGDDRTNPQRVRLVAPPAVASARATIDAPDYLRALGAPPRVVDLGGGLDERATVPGVLAGSRVVMDLTLTKAVPVPNEANARAAWLAETFGEAAGQISGMFDGARWTLALTAAQPVRIGLNLVDEFGIRAADEAAYRIQTVLDNPPEATVTVPEATIDVLPDAQVSITVEARDDLALATLSAQWQHARRSPGSAGAQPEPSQPPSDLKREAFVLEPGATPTTQAQIALTIVPRDLAAQPGDELWITAVATDVFAHEGQGHEPVRSAVRKIRIISADALTEQLWSELLSLRRAAMRAAEQQTQARERVEQARDGLASGEAERAERAAGQVETASREQGAVDEALSTMRQSLERTAARARQNGLSDRDLAEAVESASRLVDAAQGASEEAGQALREAGAAQQRPGSPAERGREAGRSAQRAGEQQAQVERALEQLADELDRGQDAWAVRRGLERLLSDQQALREQVQRQAQDTAGKAQEQLTPEQRAQAEDAAQRQQQMAERLNQLVEDMGESAKRLNQTEPTTSGALRDAAQRAQRAQTQQQMERAAEQIRQNQQQAASDQQQRAEQTLEQMMQDLQRAGRQREAVLRRELESLIESIQGLIARQQQAMRNLERRSGNLDTEMITLHTSTLDAADRARAGGRDTAAVAKPLMAAAGHQDEAVGALRAQPINADGARTAEAAALQKLNDALAEAQNALSKSQQREESQKRAELRAAYQALLVEQRLLTASTQELVGKPIDRRVRFLAADLATRQSSVQARAREILAQNDDLRKSPTFPIAHRRLDDAAGQASAMLTKAEVGAGLVIRQQSVVRTLEMLVKALADSQRDQDDPFRSPEESGQNNQGGQDGQQPEGLVPSAAEVELLKSLQEEALTVTRAADEAKDAALARQSRDDAATLQAELPRLAEEIVKKLQEQSGGGGGRPPGGPNQPQ